MKKILLLLAIGLLLAATASAQEWTGRLTGTYQCDHDMSGHLTISMGSSNHLDPAPICTSVRGTLDQYDPRPGYTLTPGYVTQNNLGNLAQPIYKCYNKFATGITTPNEWGYQFFSTAESCKGFGSLSILPTMTTPEIIGYSLKQPAPGTKEVFLCENKRDCCTAHNMPWMYYFISTDPNCRSGNRQGSTKVASLGFWPQSTEYVYQAPVVPQPEICCMLTNDRGDRKAFVAQKTQCEEEAKKMGATFTTSAKEECEKEVCCTYEGRYDVTKFRKCWERKGTVLDKTKEQCREPEPVCGNGAIERGESCETGKPCEKGYECKNCRCELIPEVCSITQTDNDKLLAELAVLDKRNRELRETRVCGVLERKEGDRIDRKICNRLGECVLEGQIKSINLITLQKENMCRTEICCKRGDKLETTNFERCYAENGVEAPAEQCKQPIALKVDQVQAPTPITFRADDFLPLLACRRTVRAGKVSLHDYYQRNKYPCPEGDTLQILGRTIKKAGVPGTAELWSCKWPAKGNENLLRVNGCDRGTDLDVKLGYVFTQPNTELGTIPLNLCIYDANGEHYATTGECEAGKKEGTYYILPFCEETDKGRDIGKKGEIKKAFGWDWASYTGPHYGDYCTSDASVLVESYCNNKQFSFSAIKVLEGNRMVEYNQHGVPGVTVEVIKCPSGICKDGACQQIVPAPIQQQQPQCTSSAECPGGQRCFAGRCALRITCETDATCPAGYRCVTPTTAPYVKECR